MKEQNIRARGKVSMKIAALWLGSLCLVAPMHAQICGPDVKHSAKTVKGKSSLEVNPPADKALVWVLAPRASTSQTKVSADRVWIGVNQVRTYFVVALNAGTHDFCSKSGPNVAHLKLTLEAGKSYFLEQRVAIGWNSWKMHGPTMLQEVTAQDAATLCKKCRRTEFAEKKD
jgi:hypothetical protein